MERTVAHTLRSLYLSAVVLAGAAAIGVSTVELAGARPRIDWFVLLALTAISGTAVLRFPGFPASFSISDVFTFMAAILFGPAAGTVTVAVDGFSISRRLDGGRTSIRRILFNSTAPAAAMWVSSQLFFRLAGVPPLVNDASAITRVFGPLILFAGVYFVLNTGLIAIAIAIEQRRSAIAIWREHFVTLWASFFGGAWVAALVILLGYDRRGGLAVILLLVPLPLLLYFAFSTALARMRERLEELEQRNQMEQRLRQAEKLDALGRLARGIVHDFNNLLMVIRGMAELIGDELPDNHPSRSELKELLAAANTATLLTGQLMAFTKQQPVQPVALNANTVVTEMVAILRRLAGSGVQIESSLAPDLPDIRADHSQLQQVIMNLVVNARDAMPGGGKVTITTTRSANRVVLSVADTGTGMSDEIRARIFEPYFTTKEKGTGLGLATVYGIVTQNGGEVRVASTLGAGTTFTIEWPSM